VSAAHAAPSGSRRPPAMAQVQGEGTQSVWNSEPATARKAQATRGDLAPVPPGSHIYQGEAEVPEVGEPGPGLRPQGRWNWVAADHRPGTSVPPCHPEITHLLGPAQPSSAPLCLGVCTPCLSWSQSHTRRKDLKVPTWTPVPKARGTWQPESVLVCPCNQHTCPPTVFCCAGQGHSTCVTVVRPWELVLGPGLAVKQPVGLLSTQCADEARLGPNPREAHLLQRCLILDDRDHLQLAPGAHTGPDIRRGTVMSHPPHHTGSAPDTHITWGTESPKCLG
jgi:hypothetical protein